MAKVISFSDFLKEGALKESPARQVEEKREVNIKPIRLEPEEVAPDADVKSFWKRLRHFFRTGEKPESTQGVLVPALIAPYLMHGNWDTEYPYYLAETDEDSQSVESLIRKSIEGIFKADEAVVLRKFIPRLVAHFRQSVSEAPVKPFAEAGKYAIAEFLKLEVHHEEGERFRSDVKKLAEALPETGELLAFHAQVPLYFVRQEMHEIQKRRQEYKNLMRQRVEELSELLSLDLEKNGKDEPEKGFDFTSGMIALDKINEMKPRSGSSKMAETRRARIKDLIKLLQETLDGREKVAHVVVNQELEHEFNWTQVFDTAKVSFTDLSNTFKRVEQIFDNNIVSFTEVIVAMQKAGLELKDKYDEEVHDDFFAHFKWFKLSTDELALFPPVVLITGGAHLLRDGMAEFSKLLSSNKPIKVLALTNRTNHEIDPEVEWEDASHSFRQELAALALSHRAAHTLQCAADRPTEMLYGISAGISSISPAVMHMLVPEKDEDNHVAFLKINAAAAARYFPYLSYDSHKGAEWGSRFDISGNSQPEKDWAQYPFSYIGEDGVLVEKELAFTYADYKAMTREKVDELFLVPEPMAGEYLIPVDEYLRLPQSELTGKVPYIWLVDEDNCMRRAAMPYMWVASCQERLEFWNFIQELGGVNSYHVRQAIARAQEEWDAAKAKEIEALKELHQREVEEVRDTAAGSAMENLANILLNLDEMPVPSPTTKATDKVPVEKEAARTQEEKKEVSPEAEEAKEEEDSISAEPWVETFRCTSCNDCTEKFPAIFKYNEEKQAYIDDASKGTFEQLVMAAEACPAACIHPGEPLNPNEPNLEELKKRAAKFN